MKKFYIVILFILLITGCQTKEPTTKKDLTSKITTSVANTNDYSDSQNDLVYHDYGTGIKLSSNLDLTISQLDLDLKEETATIYAINLENNVIIKLYDYQPNQNILFTPDSDGIYLIIAELSTGETIDLTPSAIIETSYEIETTNGIIPLN